MRRRRGWRYRRAVDARERMTAPPAVTPVSGGASGPVTAARVTVPVDEDETADHPAPGTRRPMVSTFIQPAGLVLSSHTSLQ